MKSLSLLTILWVLVVIVHGQNVNRRPDLNLGFEKRNTTNGFAETWDWWGSGYNFTIDTVEKHGGKASLKIQSKAGRPANKGAK